MKDEFLQNLYNKESRITIANTIPTQTITQGCV